jgi:protoporphyrinogen oxidase
MVRGVGVLMPEREKRASLGILFNSSTFRDRVRDADRLCSFTMMFGGTGDPEWVSATEDKIRAAVVSELREVLKLSGTCESMVIHRWPSAIPIYNQKLMSAWEAARQGWCKTPGRILFGNYSGQVSVRGMFESVATLN